MSKHKALGKGMGALLESVQDPSSQNEKKYFYCDIEKIVPLENQPRKTFSEEKMQELVASIQEKGVLQPIVVRKRQEDFQIIAGERRWRAAQEAGLYQIPVVVQDVAEEWALELALIENVQREDLNPLEEAAAYQYLLDSLELSQDAVAQRLGKSRSAITNTLRLLRLPEAIRQDLGEGRLSMGHARALLALNEPEDMLEARDRILGKDLSVRETESLVRKIKNFSQGQEQKAATEKAKDPHVADLEERLQQHLQSKVTVVAKKKGGKLEINFADWQQLERILDHFGFSLEG